MVQVLTLDSLSSSSFNLSLRSLGFVGVGYHSQDCRVMFELS